MPTPEPSIGPDEAAARCVYNALRAWPVVKQHGIVIDLTRNAFNWAVRWSWAPSGELKWGELMTIPANASAVPWDDIVAHTTRALRESIQGCVELEAAESSGS